MKQSAIVTSEESQAVKFAFGEGKLVLSSQGVGGVSTVEIPIPEDVESMTVELLPLLLSGFLSCLDGEQQISCGLDSFETNVDFRIPGYTFIQMPVVKEAEEPAKEDKPAKKSKKEKEHAASV